LAAELVKLDQALQAEGVSLVQVLAAAAGAAYGVLKDDTRRPANPPPPPAPSRAQNAV
jgi:hypothetical protein